MQRRAPLVAALLAAGAALAWLDGWYRVPAAAGSPVPPPAAIGRALGGVADDLARRAAALCANAEVARSLEGGGIAVHRQELFLAAREAMEGAAPGSWIALADPSGTVLAWWGEAPTRMPSAPRAGALTVRWSATRMELAHWRVAGGGVYYGLVCAARSLPLSAPDFGEALALTGSATRWEPVSPAEGRTVLLAGPGGAPLVAGRQTDVPIAADAGARTAGLVLTVVLALPLLTGGAGWVGGGLALAFLGFAVRAQPADRALASPGLWILALGPLLLPHAIALLRRPRVPSGSGRLLAGLGLAGLAIAMARRVVVPDLGAGFTVASGEFVGLVALTALFGSALAVGASGGTRQPRRGAAGLALSFTAAAIVAGIALVSSWPLYPAAVAAAALAAYELWRRSITSTTSPGPLGPFRLTAASALLLILVAAPSYGHDRAAAAFRTAAAIRLPDPRRISAGAVVAVLRAVERVERFDLARELPAPLADVDLSDLAYRLWREGEEQAPSSTLIAYEVFDDSGMLRSRFSLIPEVDLSGGAEGDVVRIERHRVAVVRRRALLSDGSARWGRVSVSVADWPSWDPLPPRLEVYRRLVGGEATPGQTPRPVLGLYGPDGGRRDEGPELPAWAIAGARADGRPVPIRIRYRGEELRGEVRPLKDGFQLVAVPGPDFLQRLLGATQLLAPAALLYLAGGFVLLWRLLVSGRPLRDLVPASRRTFRGRLVVLFVLSVMVPLVAVTLFLRSSIATRSRQDTLDHGRTALETARRVLDDYLPSASAGLGRLGLLDDTLLAWLANAVGYDLSVYSPEARLVATSRRDLFAAGLLPERVPGATYVAIGLGAARERTDTRLIAGSRFEEITTELASVPGVPGVRSPVLLSLLLLPQQRVAEAEAGQLTAAVSAFSLLIFVISAAIAGRLAVRVAKPVADLVEGTRAVARGDFAPNLPEPPDEELRELVRAFLYMSRSLKEQTDALSREKERLATLLSRLTAGVVAYREDGGVLLANPAAALLGGGRADGRALGEVFPGEAMADVRRALERAGPEDVSEELEPRPGERWRVVTVALPLGGAGARMAVIEDVSDLVRSNRLAAWAEMARIIAHEIKNPLTPIRLSVEHLREVWKRGSPGFDRVLEDCVDNVLRQTEALRHSAAEFSDYASLPRSTMRPTDVGALAREAAAAWTGAPGIRLDVSAAGRPDGPRRRAPVVARAREPARQLRGSPQGRRHDPGARGTPGGPHPRLGRRRRAGRGPRDPAAALRSLFLGQERRHGTRPGHRQEDRGGARRRDRGGEPRLRRLPGELRPAAARGAGGARLRRRRLLALLLAGAVAAGCHRSAGKEAAAPTPGAPALPKGDVVWLEEPLASAEPGLEAELVRLGAAGLLLPAGTVARSPEGWKVEADAPPPQAFAHVPVVLVLRAGDDLAAGLAGAAGPEAEAVARGTSASVAATIRSGAYGRVIGVHLDFPFGPAGAGRYANIVAALKAGLPAGTFVSISVRALPAGEEDRKRTQPLFAAADVLAAFVFGAGPRVDPVAIDALGRPWWATYDTRTTGTVTSAAGEARERVSGKYLDGLTGNPRIEMENDLSANDASISAFTLTARGPVRWNGLSLQAGDRVSFAVPSIGELLFELGSNLAGKHRALGRAVVFDGAVEAERLFTLAAFEDVVLGRSLSPALEATVRPAGRNAIAVELVNGAHHASIVSRVANWVEVDLSPAHPGDVQLGGFDRYEVYDAEGRPVTPGRASRVRLFETLLTPGEVVTPARIVVRGALPRDCCRYRIHASAAAGPEIATDWMTPPAPPTPAPPAKKAAPTRKRT